MQKVRKTLGGKEIVQSGTWSLQGYMPSFSELFSELIEKGEVVEFHGMYDPDPLVNFEVGKTYDARDNISGKKFKAECTAKDENECTFRIVGSVEELSK